MSWPEVVATLITTLGTVFSAWCAKQARTHASSAQKSAGDALASARRASEFPIHTDDDDAEG